jgi:hypothetical protein
MYSKMIVVPEGRGWVKRVGKRSVCESRSFCARRKERGKGNVTRDAHDWAGAV